MSCKPQVWDARSTLPISSCHLQDDTANQILRCLTAAAQSPSSSASMPSLSIRVRKHIARPVLTQAWLASEGAVHPPCLADGRHHSHMWEPLICCTASLRQCHMHCKMCQLRRLLVHGRPLLTHTLLDHSAHSGVQGKDGVMGQPLVKRLTVRSGLHPDSGAPAHLAILHVSPSVPAPAKPDNAGGSSRGGNQAHSPLLNTQAFSLIGCEHDGHDSQHSLWQTLLCKLTFVPLVSLCRGVCLHGCARSALKSLTLPDGWCANAGTDGSAMQATMQSVAQMLMREVPSLAGVVQHRGDPQPRAFTSCNSPEWPHDFPAGLPAA